LPPVLKCCRVVPMEHHHFQVLAERDRCTLCAHLGPDGAAGLATLHTAITAALVW